ncbi:helix-turn-helix domain-containing protein (plasmid) [Edwardsiella tarda]|nr:helix-turn-helix domain-containing protein [Edwardsiella tarda]
MTGYDLKLWRKSLGWSRERAAEELGVCLRSYKDYENSNCVKRAIALATLALSTENLLASLPQKKHRDSLFTILQRMHNDARAELPQAGH